MGPVLTRRTAWLLVGALAFVAMGAAVFVLPRYMVEDRKLDSDEKRLKAESDIRGSLVQAVGGLAVLAGLYFTASTLQLTRRGQLADRFSRAIGHLGEDQAAVRIGAVHELRLLVAEESGYHWRVVDVLVGFVRDRAPWPPGGSTINDRSKRVIVGFAFWVGLQLVRRGIAKPIAPSRRSTPPADLLLPIPWRSAGNLAIEQR